MALALLGAGVLVALAVVLATVDLSNGVRIYFVVIMVVQAGMTAAIATTLARGGGR
ncbi:hypothetical protein ACIP2X_06630 [Streptomyces sp. NPDC089424]|uniref:hypothetical protein n=1 Tax=Streptomyces sp. NPDC089424 TaxID=3365917 RepID=UPI00381D5F82